LFSQFFVTPQKAEEISYSRFKDLLAADRIKEVTIGKEKITGKVLMPVKEGKEETIGEGKVTGKAPILPPKEKEETFVTIRVDDPQLVVELLQHKVTFSGKSENTLL